jgi:DNA modification methylase
VNKVFFGDCRDTMHDLIAQGVKAQMCVTSPPYFGLRSYDDNAVKIDPTLPPEKHAWIVAELAKRGIHARG